jgi:hypothetical protein
MHCLKFFGSAVLSAGQRELVFGSEKMTIKKPFQFNDDEPGVWIPVATPPCWRLGTTSNFLQVFKVLVCKLAMP